MGRVENGSVEACLDSVSFFVFDSFVFVFAKNLETREGLLDVFKSSS